MLQPIKDRILIQRDEPKKVTESGFIIPEIAQEKEANGTILAVGKDVDESLKAGQRVLFGKNDGYTVDSRYCDGLENCFIIQDKQVRLIYNA